MKVFHALTDLQTAPVSIYLCLPASHLDTHKRWFRVFLNLAMHAMSLARPAGHLPALFILDEFPILGHMRQIEDAAGLMAGYGLKLWTIIQDIGQLQALYKERWQTFLGNAGVLQFFGNTDTGTCEYVSKLLGETLLVEAKFSQSIQERDPRHRRWPWERERLTSASRQAERQIVPLLRPDEVRFWFAREKNTQIVVAPHELPIKCWRVPYYAHRTFQGRARTG
jgi:type IV secretion system protein VirD4